MTVRGRGKGTTGGCLIVAFMALWSTTALSSAAPQTSRHLAVPLDWRSFRLPAAGGQLRCAECHGVPPASGAHASHADLEGYDFGFDCNRCHYVERFPELHDDGKVDVRFSPALPPIGAIGAVYLSGTCSNVYCHSDARAEARAMTWDGGTDLGCDGCHDYRTSLEIDMSGRHAFHLNSGVECAACHAEVVDATDRVTDFQRHVNGAVDVSVLAGDYDASTASCESGCHASRTWREGPATGSSFGQREHEERQAVVGRLELGMDRQRSPFR